MIIWLDWLLKITSQDHLNQTISCLEMRIMARSRPEKLSSSLKRRELYDGTDGTSWDRGRLGFIYTILLCEMSLFPYIYDLAASTHAHWVNICSNRCRQMPEEKRFSSLIPAAWHKSPRHAPSVDSCLQKSFKSPFAICKQGKSHIRFWDGRVFLPLWLLFQFSKALNRICPLSVTKLDMNCICWVSNPGESGERVCNTPPFVSLLGGQQTAACMHSSLSRHLTWRRRRRGTSVPPDFVA